MQSHSTTLSSCPQANDACDALEEKHAEGEYEEWEGYTIRLTEDKTFYANGVPASAYMPVPHRGWAQ